MVTTELWLAMVRSRIRYRMTLANVVFGPTVPGLAPSEVNDIADSSLRRQSCFPQHRRECPWHGHGFTYIVGKNPSKKSVGVQRKVLTPISCAIMYAAFKKSLLIKNFFLGSIIFDSPNSLS